MVEVDVIEELRAGDVGFSLKIRLLFCGAVWWIWNSEVVVLKLKHILHLQVSNGEVKKTLHRF